MRRLRHTKIIATLGPASSDADTIEALYMAGADLFRLNFSHGSYEEHEERFHLIRALERKLRHPIGVIADLQGPKLRLGRFATGSAWLKAGATFRLDLSPRHGDDARCCLPHPEIIRVLQPGNDLLLDDGKLRFTVTDKGRDYVDCKVVIGGELSCHKGVNVPEAVLDRPILTSKDKRDFDFALSLGVDWLALSFVQEASDVEKVKALVAGRAHVLTKMEMPEAIANLESIVKASDAVMVARGDLGVELPPEQVPIQQKRIIGACRRAGKPVVIATHMLDSMVRAPSPTRAEASDVATAVYDGADTVTLSAETAVGRYPRDSVAMMDRVIRSVEQHDLYRRIIANWHPPPQPTVSDSISISAVQAASNLSAVAIVTYTKSGSTALLAARERPEVGILGLTAELATARRLSMVWGVYAVVAPEVENFSDMVHKACRVALAEGVAKVGDLLVITAGVPFGISGTTNVMRIARVKAEHRRAAQAAAAAYASWASA